jgi:DNA-nicking Smr family endonuclease
MPRSRRLPKLSQPGPADEKDAMADRDAFLEAVRGAKPIKHSPRAELRTRPPRPVPLRHADDDLPLRQSGGAVVFHEEQLRDGEALGFLRPGLSRIVIRNLRRGHWPVRGELDLHGFTSEQASAALPAFIAGSINRGRRCVRVIHGKGLRSPGNAPVLKSLVTAWLSASENVVAFCEAPSREGGAGATLVLLAGGRRRTADLDSG